MIKSKIGALWPYINKNNFFKEETDSWIIYIFLASLYCKKICDVIILCFIITEGLVQFLNLMHYYDVKFFE